MHSKRLNVTLGAVSRIGLAAVLAIGATPALAQDSGEAEDSSDTIIVTAQFREQNLQDTPIAITAVSAEMLEARSQTSIQDVANQAPSVTLKSQGAAFGPSLGANIRGVGQFDFNPALEPGVGLYVDDVYYATLTGSILDLLDLDRVEILRGPQGTLSGRNSIGGAVRLFSQRPEGSNTGTITATYGSRNRLDLRASADFNLMEGVDFRMSAVSKQQEGYVDRLDFGCVYPAGGSATFTRNFAITGAPTTLAVNPVGGVPQTTNRSDCLLGKESEVGYMAVRGQLRIRPQDNIDINIAADYTSDDRTTAGNVLLNRTYPNGEVASPRYPLPLIPATGSNPAQNFATVTPPTRDINPFAASSLLLSYDNRFICGDYCNYGTYNMPADGAFRASSADGRINYEGWGLSGQIEWELSDSLQLNSITAYRTYLSEFSNDNDASPLTHSLGYGPLTFDFFSQELRLNGAIGETVEFTLGAYYSDQQSVYASFQDLRSSGLQFQQNDPVNADSKALFAHASWNPLEPLTITGGIRYTEESKTYQYIRQRPYLDSTSTTANGVLPLNEVIGSYSGNRVDYRANIQYALTDELMAYAQYSTGYKGGGVNPRPFFVQQALPFGPETLTAYELGLKSDLFDRRLRVNVAAYLSQYQGIQLSLGNCTAITGPGFGAPCALPVNAGDADIKGIEVEATLRPVDGLTIDGAVSYLDFNYKRFGTFTSGATTVAVGGPTNLAGPQFGDYAPFTPEWKWSFGIQYEIDMGATGSLTPRFDAAYQGDVYTASANRSSNLIEAYTIANARLTWNNADDDLSLSLAVTNLFDEYYLLTIFDQTIGGQGYATGQPGRPREWSITLTKHF
jgi:iron complex outermembrane receptor protein